MTIERAIELAGNWAEGKINHLATGELKEYHAAARDALQAMKEWEDNPPLTEDDLLEMDGRPVWIESKATGYEEPVTFWALVSVDEDSDEITLTNSLGGASPYEEVYLDIDIYRHERQ